MIMTVRILTGTILTGTILTQQAAAKLRTSPLIQNLAKHEPVRQAQIGVYLTQALGLRRHQALLLFLPVEAKPPTLVVHLRLILSR